MKKFLTKGAATAFLIAASTSSALGQQSQVDSTISIGMNLEPIFYIGNMFNKIEYQANGETNKLADKSMSFAIRATLPEFSFAITDQFKVGVKLFGQYNASYTQDVTEASIKNITITAKDSKEFIESRQLTFSGYAFGVKTEAEFCFYNGDDMSMGVALGPVLQFNHLDIERKVKGKSNDEDAVKSKADWWSLDASIGLKMSYNITESLQLRAGVAYETANLAKFGNKINSDKLSLEGDANNVDLKNLSGEKEGEVWTAAGVGAGLITNLNTAKTTAAAAPGERRTQAENDAAVKTAQDAIDNAYKASNKDNGDKTLATMEALAHKIVLSIGLHFSI
jgi:hypothetical protein